MRLATIVLSIAGILSMAGCSTISTQTASHATDSNLEQTILTKINQDPQVQAAGLKVSADAANNQATLSGTAPSEQVRLTAVELAKTAQPGLVVTDRIEVKPVEVSRADFTDEMARQTREKAKALGDKIGNSLDDAWLYTKVEAKFATNTETPALKINVDVTNGIVTLRGEVETHTAKTEAVRLARETNGVRGVRDFLKLQAGA